MKALCSFIVLLLCLDGCAVASSHTVPIPTYLHLKGKINDKYAITMDLLIVYWGGRGICYSGYYYYDRYEKPIPIEFYLGSYQNDTINIQPQGNERFKGHFDGLTFSGMWYLEDGFYTQEAYVKKRLKQLPFNLAIDTSDCIRLSTYSYSDSLVLFKKFKSPPSSFFSYALLFNDSSEDSKLNKILCHLYGKKEIKSDVVKKLKQESKRFYKDFRQGAYRMSTPEELQTLGEWVLNYNSAIIYNSKKLLTIKFTNSGNEGGNHGYNFSKYYSYSVKDKRLIKMADFINSKDSLILKALLIKSMRTDKWLPNDMDEGTAMKTLIPTDFYVTSSGVALLYPTMAPGGATALIPFFIPFTEFGDKLKRQSWMD